MTTSSSLYVRYLPSPSLPIKWAVQFYPKAHSVTQSTFAAPCTLAPNGKDSGFQKVADPSAATQSFNVSLYYTSLWLMMLITVNSSRLMMTLSQCGFSVLKLVTARRVWCSVYVCDATIISEV